MNIDHEQITPLSTNKKAFFKHTDSVLVVWLNVRTLKHQENLDELEYAFQNSNLDIIGLAEIRREGDTIITTKLGNLLCYIGTKGGQRGVGFLIKENLSQKISEFRGISDRIALVKFNLEKQTLTIIQIYTPTALSEEVDCDLFYNNLTDFGNDKLETE